MMVPLASCDAVLPSRTLLSSTTVSCSITPKPGQSLPVKGTRWVWVSGSWCGTLLAPALSVHGVLPFLLLPWGEAGGWGETGIDPQSHPEGAKDPCEEDQKKP